MSKITPPSFGTAITLNADQHLNIPDQPIIPFIEGDGIGWDITPVMRTVVDTAVKIAYGERRRVAWMEIYAGEKANQIYGNNTYLPEETISALQKYRISIKGPLATPVGGGMRSLNVALRQQLDLYVCLRPIQYFSGVPSPLKNPQKTNITVFRENTEDIYSGIEWKSGTEDVKKVLQFLIGMGVGKKIRFPESSAIGVKAVSEEGSKRLVQKAIQYAIDNHKKSVTLVHKGNIMKFTEGGFRDWGYQVAKQSFRAVPIENSTFYCLPQGIVIKDCIADAFLQEILLRPEDHDVVATLNLNGDYISDALAAQVGGIGISPGANLSDDVAIFEATHGTAPNIAGKNLANPSSLILSAEMLLRFIGWKESADLILRGISLAILSGKVTIDFAKHMEESTQVSTREFGECIVKYME